MVSLEDKIGHLKKLYKDIVLGFSVYNYAGKPIFIKHFSEIDNASLELERGFFLSDAKKKGMLEREEKKKILISEGIWSEEKENNIETFKKEISDLELVGKNLIIKRQILQNKEKIKQVKKNLDEALREKDDIFGFCLEDFVEKKMNELMIFNCFYKDRSLTNRFFTEEEFDLMLDIEMSELISVLNGFYVDFAHKQIKRICATPFFMSIFALSEDNCYHFFGKPISDLTILQVHMFSQGRYFKNLIQSHSEKTSPPSDVLEDPDKMLDWYDSITVSKTSQADGVGYVGATRSELEKIAGGKGMSVNEFASKKGNLMTTKDFVEMHGI